MTLAVPVGGTGNLVIEAADGPDADRVGGPALPDATVKMITGFADHAALPLEIAEHRRDAEQLLVLNDRDRIARDLHDLAIQRLFASGLGLQSVLNRVGDRAEVAERVVDDLDDTIKVVRSAIYALRESDRPDAVGLRARLVAEVGQAAEVLGFTPALRMSGLLDTNVPEGHSEHLFAVVREALSNAARHAHATTVEVTAEATDTELRLRVADNGRGIDRPATRSSGLANLRTRAEVLGGTFTVAPHVPSGTVLEWTVPLRGDAP